MIFRLPIGDWSKDGHKQADYYDIKTDIESMDELSKVFNEVVNSTFDFTRVCEDYEDNTVYEDDPAHKYLEPFCEPAWNQNDAVQVYPDGMANGWCEWMQQNSEHTFEVVPKEATFYRGSCGYGLYY